MFSIEVKIYGKDIQFKALIQEHPVENSIWLALNLRSILYKYLYHKID